MWSGFIEADTFDPHISPGVGYPGGSNALPQLLPVFLKYRPSQSYLKLVPFDEGSNLVTGDGLCGTIVHDSLDMFGFLGMVEGAMVHAEVFVWAIHHGSRQVRRETCSLEASC
jgi:hypothetical protein